MRYNIPVEELNTKILKNQSGQSLIEFVLLLVLIVVISTSFMRIVNTNTADIWTRMATLILDNPDETLQLK